MGSFHGRHGAKKGVLVDDEGDDALMAEIFHGLRHPLIVIRFLGDGQSRVIGKDQGGGKMGDLGGLVEAETETQMDGGAEEMEGIARIDQHHDMKES